MEGAWEGAAGNRGKPNAVLHLGAQVCSPAPTPPAGTLSVTCADLVLNFTPTKGNGNTGQPVQHNSCRDGNVPSQERGHVGYTWLLSV